MTSTWCSRWVSAGLTKGLNPGTTSLMTPLYKNATIQRKMIIPSRTDPDYYRGLPFIPITNHAGGWTGIAFHIFVFTDDMVRGFVSHGCMRMRQTDLMALFSALYYGSWDVPIDLFYRLPEAQDHPFPLDDSDYWTVENFGTPDKPVSEENPTDHLTIMQDKWAKPPVDGLVDPPNPGDGIPVNPLPIGPVADFL